MNISLIKNIVYIFLLIFILISCSKKEENLLSNSQYFLRYHIDEAKIDSGFLFKDSHLQKIVILLNKKYDKPKIIEILQISSIEYDDLINSLFGSGLIKKTDNGKFIPSFPIIDFTEEKKIKKFSTPIGEDISLIVIDRLKNIENEIQKLPSYSPNNYTLRYFIFSDVLLNSRQIKNIKENFIKSLAPIREDRHIYLALIEGNTSFGDSSYHSFINAELNENSDVIEFHKSENFSPADIAQFQSIADIIKKDLSDYLNNKRRLFLENYSISNLQKTTSFKEYTFWVYQYIVNDAIKSLVKHGVIIQPKHN